ncbi:MAG TPA: S8 family serine peptidase [Candidatus Angelobacter sp.]|nr:S8 family serine peptidase [Candidatus Angelobacter sp.]
MIRRKLILSLLLLAMPLAMFADNSKISPDLQNSASTAKVQVVVQYAPGTQLSCSGLLGLVGCVLNDVVKLGGSVLGQLPLVNGLVASLDHNGIVSLSNQSNVVYISRDRTLTPFFDSAAPAVNASAAWKSNFTGSGIGVALIDSGVNSHPDLNNGLLPFSRVVYNQSFVPGDSKTTDAYGHGTHIAGLIAGDGLSSTGPLFSQTFKGIAPNAQIVNLRVLNANGSATDSSVIAAINQAISLKSRYNIRVINLSLGRGVYESYKLDPLCQAVEKAWKNGIVVVVAAGNNGRSLPTTGYATVNAPANDPYVLTVGSMKPMGTADRSDDQIASYSSKGPTVLDHIVKPDVVAPGNLLVSTETANTALYSTEPDNLVPYSDYVYGGPSTPSKQYFELSGTSMATGVVSGMVADLLQAHPTMTPDQVKARLMKTASKTFPTSSSVYDPASGITYTSQYDVFTVGAGYVDLAAALASTELSKGTSMSPTAVYDSNTGNVYLTSDASSVWGTSQAWSGPAVWGNSQFVGGSAIMWGASNPGGSAIMWGAGTPNGSAIMWGATSLSGSAIMWGASTSSGFSAVWGNAIMWGASGPWSNAIMWGASGEQEQ